MRITIYLLCTILIDANAMLYNASLLDSKIINGNLANETELPYMASLQIEGKHICGGCLISEEHVLSSAQCIIHILKYGGHNFINATVVIGVTDLSKNGIIHTIRYVHHFHYTRNNEFIVEEAYDVGLILLQVPVTISDTVMPIPMSETIIRGCYTGSLAGWSVMQVKDKSTKRDLWISDKLRVIKIKLKNYLDCMNDHGEERMKPSLICGSCIQKRGGTFWGDAGSPLVNNKKVIGIVTYVPSNPIVFVRANNIIGYVHRTMHSLINNFNLML